MKLGIFLNIFTVGGNATLAEGSRANNCEYALLRLSHELTFSFEIGKGGGAGGRHD